MRTKGKSGDRILTPVRLSDEKRDELEKIAIEQGRSMSEILREALYWWIEEYKVRKEKIKEAV